MSLENHARGLFEIRSNNLLNKKTAPVAKSGAVLSGIRTIA